MCFASDTVGDSLRKPRVLFGKLLAGCVDAIPSHGSTDNSFSLMDFTLTCTIYCLLSSCQSISTTTYIGEGGTKSSTASVNTKGFQFLLGFTCFYVVIVLCVH